jgi:hypothetical protein
MCEMQSESFDSGEGIGPPRGADAAMIREKVAALANSLGKETWPALNADK